MGIEGAGPPYARHSSNMYVLPFMQLQKSMILMLVQQKVNSASVQAAS